MDIAESIYESFVEPSYKIPTRADTNSAGQISKMRGESAFSNTHSDMSESSGKLRKRYVEHPKDISKPTCLIS